MAELEKIKEFFSKDIYATETTGAVIEEAGANYAKCSLKIDSRHQKATGEVMGGAIFTLADFTFAVAANAGGKETVTSVSQISYLTRVKGNVLFAESRLIKDGRTACFFEISVTDNLGTPVAVVNVSGIHTGREIEY